MNDDDTLSQTPDNGLDPVDNTSQPLVDENHDAQDDEPPFSPANDVPSAVNIDDPATDDSLDSDELYQEGIGGATNADDASVAPDDEPRPLQTEN